MFGKNTEQLNRELDLLLGSESKSTVPPVPPSKIVLRQPTSPSSTQSPAKPEPLSSTPQSSATTPPSVPIPEKPAESNPVASTSKTAPTSTPPAKKPESATPAPPVPSKPYQPPKLAPMSSPVVNRPFTSLHRPIPEQSMRISKGQWDKYHESWQDYYKNFYKKQAEQAKESKPNFEQALREEIQNEARRRPMTWFKKLFSRKVLPFTCGVLAILILLGLQYSQNVAGFFVAFIAPSSGDMVLPEIPNPSVGATISAEPKLFIPKINVAVPIVFGVASDVDSQNRAMENGVAHFSIPGANAMPGQTGNLAIAGHSSSNLWERGDFKFIFARLERLDAGDTIFLDYGDTRFVYRITGKEEVQPHQSDRLLLGNDRPMLTLITCTPVGTAHRRLLVFAEQISPNPATAVAPPASNESTDEEIKIPSNAPTFFDRIRNLFTF